MMVALCLGGALTACGAGDDGGGYAAVGTGAGQKGAVPPSGSVTLVPLDPTSPGLTSSTSRPSPRPSTSDTAPGAARAEGPGLGSSGGPGGPGGGTATAPPAVPGATAPPRTPERPGDPTGPATPTRPTTTPPAPRPSTTTPPPATPSPPTPAALTLSAPVLTDTDRRWCENVTVTFRNAGGTAVRSGTVAFATHVIGALGVHWATVHSSQPLPAPLAAGATRTHTYTVCVDSWRVPLGMRVDTRKVTAQWR
ncbi:hypothetical protein GCM10017752_33530 [Streptomyces roseoviridis]